MSDLAGGIDLNYRPRSYFWARQHGIPLISDIKGAERRKLYEGALQSGLSDVVDSQLLQHSLPYAQRQAQGQIHPAFMGGEYLPSNKFGEVEIARITIASTTQDVTCVYARLVGNRLHYRIVDEYEGMTLDAPTERTSARPLALKRLVEFFLKGWNLIECLGANFEEHGYPRDKVHFFIVDASSSFYAEFGELVHLKVDEWLNTLRCDEDERDDE